MRKPTHKTNIKNLLIFIRELFYTEDQWKINDEAQQDRTFKQNGSKNPKRTITIDLKQAICHTQIYMIKT